jgi:hypothetical protein
MGNAHKQLFFGPILYPSITCPICNSLEIDTWPHVLLSCTNPHIHALRIKHHNKAVTEIRKLLVYSSHSRSYILTPKGPETIFKPFLKFRQAIVKAIFIKNS